MTCINMPDILKGEIWTMWSEIRQDQSYAWNIDSDNESRCEKWWKWIKWMREILNYIQPEWIRLESFELS